MVDIVSTNTQMIGRSPHGAVFVEKEREIKQLLPTFPKPSLLLATKHIPTSMPLIVNTAITVGILSCASASVSPFTFPINTANTGAAVLEKPAIIPIVLTEAEEEEEEAWSYE